MSATTFSSTRTACGRMSARRCNMFPNGSGGSGRFAQVTGLFRLSREALKISTDSAVRRMRRAGNVINFGKRPLTSKSLAVWDPARSRRR